VACRSIALDKVGTEIFLVNRIRILACDGILWIKSSKPLVSWAFNSSMLESIQNVCLQKSDGLTISATSELKRAPGYSKRFTKFMYGSFLDPDL